MTKNTIKFIFPRISLYLKDFLSCEINLDTTISTCSFNSKVLHSFMGMETNR